MKLETVLQLLYSNDLQDVVARAVQIDNNIAMPYKVGDMLLLNIPKSKLPEGRKFKGEGWGNVYVKIEVVNAYSLDKPYLIALPNGEHEWVKGEDNRREVTEIVDAEGLAVPAHVATA